MKLDRVKAFFCRFESYFEQCRVKKEYATEEPMVEETPKPVRRSLKGKTKLTALDVEQSDPKSGQVTSESQFDFKVDQNVRKRIGDRVRKAKKTAKNMVLVNGELLPLINEGDSVIRRRKRGDFTPEEDERILYGYAISARIIRTRKSGFWIPISKLFTGGREMGRESCRRRYITLTKNKRNEVRAQQLVIEFEVLYERALITKELDSLEDTPPDELDYTQALAFFKSHQMTPFNTASPSATLELPDSVEELEAMYNVSYMHKTKMDLGSELASEVTTRRRIAILYSVPLTCHIGESIVDEVSADRENTLQRSLCEGVIKV